MKYIGAGLALTVAVAAAYVVGRYSGFVLGYRIGRLQHLWTAESTAECIARQAEMN